MKHISALLGIFSIFSFALAAPQVEKKFYFDGATQKHPVSMELEHVAYKPKGMDLTFKVTNNSNTPIDFSRSNWKLIYGNVSGYIKESEFDGMLLHPKSKRMAKISFFTEDAPKPGFSQERAKGTSQIEIDNIFTSDRKKLAKIKLKNY